MVSINDRILFEDGKGNLLSEEDEQIFVLDMKVDEVRYPLEDITTYETYMEQKPPEKLLKAKQEIKSSTNADQAINENSTNTNKNYRNYKPNVKNYFCYLIYEKNMSVRATAKELKIPQSTVQTWKKADQAGDEELNMRKHESGKKKLVDPSISQRNTKFF